MTDGEKMVQTLWDYSEFWQRPEIIANLSAIELEEVTDPKKWEEIVRNIEAVIERDLDLHEFVDFAHDDDIYVHYNETIPHIYSYIRSDAFKKDDFETVFMHFVKYVCNMYTGLLKSNWNKFSMRIFKKSLE